MAEVEGSFPMEFQRGREKNQFRYVHWRRVEPDCLEFKFVISNPARFLLRYPQPAGSTVGTIPAGSAVLPSRLRAVLGLAPRFWN